MVTDVSPKILQDPQSIELRERDRDEYGVARVRETHIERHT